MLMHLVNQVAGLLCYNCSVTHRQRANCGGDFAPALQSFRNDRALLVNCSGGSPLVYL